MGFHDCQFTSMHPTIIRQQLSSNFLRRQVMNMACRHVWDLIKVERMLTFRGTCLTIHREVLEEEAWSQVSDSLSWLYSNVLCYDFLIFCTKAVKSLLSWDACPPLPPPPPNSSSPHVYHPLTTWTLACYINGTRSTCRYVVLVDNCLCSTA